MTALEVADIFRDQGPAWRQAQAGHLSLDQLKVMSAIERCRSAALGGHVLCCEDCAQIQIAYNSCRNRHCPKCQGSAARRWLQHRQADLLPVDYYHVVFTLPAPISDIAYHNKAVIYHLLFKASAETLLTIAADPKRLGARLGLTAVLHTWGSALTHHPHIHCIVPGGGLSLDGQRWVACKPGFFLPVRVWNSSVPRTTPGVCSSSARTRTSPRPGTSPTIWRHYARPNGWSMPSGSLTCRATPIGSPSATAGCSLATNAVSPSSGRTIAPSGGIVTRP
jgi:hypothetical protein